ncbi:MAG: type II secretion system GspH family protein [Planctomycetaceae bacterium]|nr:type II secretion system GspH family protein [Planctomycetaceae bacterium]
MRDETMHKVLVGRRTSREGFTLVELLVVIAILGILAGLLAWGVNAARISILKQAQAFEIQSIASAVEAYRNKYGDYPPDGSSWPVMEAHLRKAFPNILVTELALLNPANSAVNGYVRNDNDLTGSHPLGGRVFDPAEALVFFLGGFSNDPQRPISGPGGPLRQSGSVYIYNTQRENAFFEFKLSRLTLGANGISTDETSFGEGVNNDLMPVYIGTGPAVSVGRPIVYFDSRTYQFSTTAGTYFNFYVPGAVSSSPNCARPFLSTDINPNRPGTLLYANNKTYQLMNAGYDNFYGCRAPKDLGAGLVLFQVPGGNGCAFDRNAGGFVPPSVQSAIRFYLPEFGRERPVDDNTSNFIDGPTFGQSS